MASSSSRTPSRSVDDDTFWTRLSPTSRHASCVALLLVVAMAFYWPILFGGKTIHGNDSVSWRANANALIEYEEETGREALWAPNVFGGMPAYLIQYSEEIPQIDTLLQETRSFAWPVSHLFVLMLGTYLLGFYLVRNHWAGVLAAVAFGFTTYLPIILAVGHNTKFIALAYSPYILLAFVHTLRKPSLLGGLLFALALALGLRADHPQIIYYVLMVALVWWVVTLVRAWQDDELVPFAKSTGWLALGTGLALLMVAQPYLAIYQYKQYSVRGAEAAAGGGGGSAMGWQKAMAWSQGVKELITLVIAEAFGGGGGTYWGPKTFTEGPHYVGGVVAALAGLAIWRVRNWVTWGLGAGVLATILFSLGHHAAWINGPMFEFFPFFDAFRAPETWLSITALGLAVLAGLGLNYTLRRSPRRGKKRRQTQDARLRPILIAFGVVFGLVALLWLARDTVFSFEKPNEEQRIVQAIQRQNPNLSPQNRRVQQAVRQEVQRRKEQRRTAFTTDAQRTLLFVFLAGLALVLYRRETIPAWGAGLIVAAIVTVDLWGVDKRYFGDNRLSEAQPIAQAIPTYEFDQFINQKREELGGPGHFRILSLVEGSPTSTARPSYHHQQIGGYHGAKLQRYQEYLDHILQLTQTGRPTENGLDLMNTRYIVARQQLPGTEVVHRSQQSGVLVLRNPDAVPRGFLVGSTEVINQPQETWQRLRSDEFNPQQTAILPEPMDAPVTPIDSSSTAEVTLESYTPPEIEWTIRTDAPRLFVASEVYYPAGWNAYLDGEEVPIHRVDYLLRGVHMPEGEHTLVMRFEPQADRYGTWIAAISTVLVYGGILGILGVRVRRRREESEDDEGDDET